ncbi:19558_t:CDS:2, partial [Cetraspora pellucida]
MAVPSSDPADLCQLFKDFDDAIIASAKSYFALIRLRNRAFHVVDAAEARNAKASSTVASSASSPDAITNPVPAPIPDVSSLILPSQKVVNLTATMFPPSSLSSSSVSPVVPHPFPISCPICAITYDRLIKIRDAFKEYNPDDSIITNVLTLEEKFRKLKEEYENLKEQYDSLQNLFIETN